MGSFSSLKNNPIFQLSLASKELFHSNFLYWLATDPNTLGLFKNILDKMGVQWHNNYNHQDYVVCREKDNFDFSIWKKKQTSTPKKNTSCEESDDTSEEGCVDCAEIKKIEPACSDPYAKLDKVVFVLENKFKSIPSKDQLDDYASQVFKINCGGRGGDYTKAKKSIGITSDSKANVRKVYDYWKSQTMSNNATNIKSTLGCDFVLLTLATQFSQRKAIVNEGIWQVVNYSQYAAYLSANVSNNSSFCYNLIQRYHDFINTFANETNKDLGTTIYAKNIFDTCKDPIAKSYAEIRMHDIWQKLVISCMIDSLVGKIPTTIANISPKSICEIADDSYIFEGKIRNSKGNPPTPKNDIFIGLDYGTSGASLNVKYKLNNDFAFIIEIQGNYYRRGILYYKGANSQKTNQQGTYNAAIKAFQSLSDFFTNNRQTQPVVPYDTSLQSNGCADKDWGNFGKKAGAKIHMIYQSVQLSGSIKGNNRNVRIVDIEDAILYDLKEIITRFP